MLISDSADAGVAPDVAERPACKSYAQLSAERAARKAKKYQPKKAAPPLVGVTEAQGDPDSAPAWLLDALQVYEQHDSQARAERTQVFVRERVQLQPLPRLVDLLELGLFRPKRGRGAGTAGAGDLAVLLDELGRIFLAARLYLYDKEGRPPQQVVMHLCAELLAKALGVSETTLREWTTQLQASGFLYARQHYTTATSREGKRVTFVDGMLYAVRMAPDHEARLRHRDYKRQYRNLDADRAAGRTAYNAIRNAEKRAREALEFEGVLDDENNTVGSQNPTGQVQAELREQLRRWAVIPGNIDLQNPLKIDPTVFNPEGAVKQISGVQDVVYLLPALLEAHKSKRAALVGMLGAALARDLNDRHSREYYCKVIWQAWQAEIEGRDGLHALVVELQRLEVDRREWKGLRRPAALLASRLRAA